MLHDVVARSAQTAFPTNTGHVSTPNPFLSPSFFPLSILSFSIIVICATTGGQCLFSPMPFEARVKSVLSGDTVVLSHVTNPSQERILSLAYVSAPRLRREGDEVGNLFLSNWPVWERISRVSLNFACSVEL